MASSITTMLRKISPAQHPESHRSAILRYREKCKLELAHKALEFLNSIILRDDEHCFADLCKCVTCFPKLLQFYFRKERTSLEMAALVRALLNTATDVIDIQEDAFVEFVDQEMLAAQLKTVLHSWIGLSIKTPYPLNLDNVYELVRREFGNLLGDSLDGISPKAIEDKAKRFVVGVESVAVENKKRRSLRIKFDLGGQDASLEWNANDQCKYVQFFVDSAANKVCHVEVWKLGKTHKLMGAADVCLNTTSSDSQSVTCKLSRENGKAGSIKLCSNVTNIDCPSARDYIVVFLTQQLVARVAHVFRGFRRLQILLKEISEAVQDVAAGSCSVQSYVVEVEQESLKPAHNPESNEPRSLVLYNGKQLELGSYGNISVRCEIDDLCADTITIERRKSTRTPNVPRRVSKDFGISSALAKSQSTQSLQGVLKMSSSTTSLLNLTSSAANTFEAIFSESLSIHKIPIRTGLSLSHGSVVWTVSIRLANGNAAETSFDVRLLALALVHSTLLEMSREQKLSWDGRLDACCEEVLGLCWPFCQKSLWPLARAESLVIAHARHHFNSKVMLEAVTAAVTRRKKSKPVEDIQGLKEFLRFCGKSLAELNVTTLKDEYDPQLNQVNYLVHAIGILEKEDIFEVFLESYQSNVGKLVESQIGATLNLEEHLTFAVNYIIPTLNFFKKRYGDLTSHCTAALASTTLSMSLPMCEMVIPLNSDIDGELTFQLFQRYRQILVFSPAHEEAFYGLFEQCLSSWVDAIGCRAMQQVSKALEIHYSSEEKEDDWVETAISVDGIFRSCEITWMEISWPKPETNIDFGAKILRRLMDVLSHFAHSFYKLVFDDQEFDQKELVLVLNCLSQSINYLQSMFDNLETFVTSNQEAGCTDLLVKVQEFSKLLNDSQGMAYDFSDKFVLAFCESVSKRHFDAFLKAGTLFDANNDNSILGHANYLLSYIHSHLKLSSKKLTDAYERTITAKLFEEIDKKFSSAFVEAQDKYARSGRNPSLMSSFAEAFFQLVQFRQSVGLQESSAQREIAQKLEVTSRSSRRLISTYIFKLNRAQLLQEEQEGSGANVVTASVRGVVKYETKIEESSREGFINLVVNLKSLTDIVPRKKREPKSNLCVVVAAVPGDDSKATTVVYEGVTSSVLFDWNAETDARVKSSFVFPIAIGEVPSTYLVLELFDHSHFKTHKVFRGLCAQPLEEVVAASESVWTQKVRKVPAVASEEWLELQRRNKDPVAVEYVMRHESQIKESRIIVRNANRVWFKTEM